MGAVTLRPEDAADLAHHFNQVLARVPLRPIETGADYAEAVAAMDALADAGAADQAHPLADLLALIGSIVGDYDDACHVVPDTTPSSILAFAMDQQGLNADDLPEIGDRAAVTDVLEGRRDLTLSQTRRVAERLGISSAAFL